MNGKKITSSVLAAIMLAGTTNVFAAMPDKSVVIGEKAFAFKYANAEENKKEILDTMKNKGEGGIYVKAMNKWYNNDNSPVEDTSVIPAVVYTNVEGETANYAEADGEVIGENTEFEVVEVSAISNTKVIVTLEEDCAAVASNFQIVKKGSDKTVEIKGIVKEADKKFVLETEALTGGSSYTLTANDKSLNFTGIAADTSAPTLVKVSSTDTNVIKVEFSDRMDFETATNVENYVLNKDVKVVAAELDSTRTKVTLTTEGLKRNIVYSLTMQDIQNSDGKAISKSRRTLTAAEDRIAPKVTTLQVQNNRMIVVKFSDYNGMNKESLENIANYSINDLEITEVKAYDTDYDDLYETVVLSTDTQVTNKSYTLTVSDITDDSTLKNSLGTITRRFRGASEDKTSPRVSTGSISSNNNNTVDIEFTDTNAIDMDSAQDVSNYEIVFDNGQILPVTEAELWYDSYPEGYKAGLKGVTLTTAQQEIGKTYRLTVRGVQDEFGNELKAISGTTYAKYTFQGSPIDTQAPYVKKVEYVSPTKVRLIFNEKVVKSEAQDPTNYVFSGGLGSAIKAVRKSPYNVVELTTQTQVDNKTYSVTMNNINDYYDNMLVDAKATFVSTSDTLDVKAPEVSYITVMNNQEVHVYFDEVLDVDATLPNLTIQEWDTSADKFVGTPITLTAKGHIEEGQTAVYMSNTKLGDKNYKIKTIETGEFKDNAKNVLNNAGLLPKEDRYLFAGTSADNMPAEVEYIEQIDARTIRAHFTKAVVISAYTGYNVSTADKFTDNAYTNAWDLQKTNGIFEAGKKLSFNFTNYAKDIVGTGVVDTEDTASSTSGKTDFTPYLEDVSKPIIVGVVAANKDEITLTYDKALKSGGTYKVYYLNKNDQKIYVYSGAGSVGYAAYDEDHLVTLEPTTSLQASKTYYLEPMAAAMDIAGNRADVSDIKLDFPGSDITVSSYVKGVAIINGNTVKISTGKKVKDIEIYEYDTENKTNLVDLNTVEEDTNSSRTSVQYTLDVPVLQGKTYNAVVTFDDNKTESYTFEGNTPDIGIYIDRQSDATKFAKLTYSGLDSKAYNIAVYEVPSTGGKATLYAKNVYDPSTQTFTTTGTARIDVDQNGTTGKEDGTDDILTFTTDTAKEAAVLGKEFYVVLTDTVDTARVLYGGKVAVGPGTTSSTTSTVSTTYELSKALADRNVTSITLAKAMTGTVTINRLVDINILDNEDIKLIIDTAEAGNINISGTGKLNGLEIDTPNATVTNNVDNKSTTTITAVAAHSYVSSMDHAGLITVSAGRLNLSGLAANDAIAIAAGGDVVLAGQTGTVTAAAGAKVKVEAGTTIASIAGTGAKLTIENGSTVAEITGTFETVSNDGTITTNTALEDALIAFKSTATTEADIEDHAGILGLSLAGFNTLEDNSTVVVAMAASTTTDIAEIKTTFDNAVYDQAEIEVAAAAAAITSLSVAADATELTLPTSANHTITIKSTTNAAIQLDGTITPPATDTTGTIILKVTHEATGLSADTDEMVVVVPKATK